MHSVKMCPLGERKGKCIVGSITYNRTWAYRKQGPVIDSELTSYDETDWPTITFGCVRIVGQRLPKNLENTIMNNNLVLVAQPAG